MTIHILLVEDSPSDADLLLEVMEEARLPTQLYVVEDGVEAIAFLRHQGQYADKPRPDLILLDLNLPRKDGREVLAEVKTDRDLGTIPVIVLTTSAANEDIRQAYELHANCYITKPAGLDDFIQMVKVFEQFWLTAVQLPPRSD
ncbi:response regulator [Pantanalinema rosaneae CENA516]|uniref:response regulator n=1 Tax=Pantanalinema rosaneae TaxID=1620701 RepID=UPI003D6FEDD4